MDSHICELTLFGNTMIVTPWLMVGIIGALLFTSRWFVQLYYSRKEGRSTTPRLFWVMSLAGSLVSLAYFTFSPKQDMVGILQNLFPFGIASYNLYLETRWKQNSAADLRVRSEPTAG